MNGISEEDSEEDNKEEELNNLVAFIGITKFVESKTDSEDNQSVADDDIAGDYQELCQTLIHIGKENLCQKNEKVWLEETVVNIRKELYHERKMDLSNTSIKREKLHLATRVDILEKEVQTEKRSCLNYKTHWRIITRLSEYLLTIF